MNIVHGVRPGVPWGALGGPLVFPWGSFGSPWGPRGGGGGPEDLLGCPGEPLEVPWGPLKVPWGRLGQPAGAKVAQNDVRVIKIEGSPIVSSNT